MLVQSSLPFPAPETWRPVVGHEGRYEVSDLGRVRSLRRLWRNQYGGVNDAVRAEPLVLQLLRRSRYLAVAIGGRSRDVHGLVLEAFVGPRPPGMHGSHENGDPHDNRLANLSWKTPTANQRDKERHGTVARGERNGAYTQPERHRAATVRGERVGGAKLTVELVVAIRDALAAGESHRRVGARFGVNEATVRKVKRRETWGHVE